MEVYYAYQSIHLPARPLCLPRPREQSYDFAASHSNYSTIGKIWQDVSGPRIDQGKNVLRAPPDNDGLGRGGANPQMIMAGDLRGRP